MLLYPNPCPTNPCPTHFNPNLPHAIVLFHSANRPHCTLPYHTFLPPRSLHSFSVDSGAEFSGSLDVASNADSKLVRMRAIQKAAELAEVARQYYLDGVRMIMYLGEHAAGLHRARER